MNKPMIAVLSTVAGIALGVTGAFSQTSKEIIRQSKEIKRQIARADKHLELFLMMNQWVKNEQEHKTISDWLEKQGYKTIAIYGMSYAGQTLEEGLKKSPIKVSYGIDKNAEDIYSDIDVVTPDDELNDADAIVVTSVTYFDDIREELSKKANCTILSLSDIIFGMR